MLQNHPPNPTITTALPPPQEPALYTGSSVLDRNPDQQQCCVAIAFKGAAWTDPDSVPLMVMQTLLGGWDRNNTSGKHAGTHSYTHVLLSCLLLDPCWHDLSAFVC